MRIHRLTTRLCYHSSLCEVSQNYCFKCIYSHFYSSSTWCPSSKLGLNKFQIVILPKNRCLDPDWFINFMPKILGHLASLTLFLPVIYRFASFTQWQIWSHKNRINFICMFLVPPLSAKALFMLNWVVQAFFESSLFDPVKHLSYSPKIKVLTVYCWVLRLQSLLC